MGVLDRFERRIERVVNGAFAKAFRSQVEPVELAGALRTESDNRAAVVSRGRTLTANSYTIELSASDYERLEPIQAELRRDLRQVVGDHAVEQGYSFVGPINVGFECAEDLDTGIYRVRSNTLRPDGSPAAQPPNRGGYDPESRANPIVAEEWEQRSGHTSSRPNPQVAPQATGYEQAPAYAGAPAPAMGRPRGAARPGAAAPGGAGSSAAGHPRPGSNIQCSAEINGRSYRLGEGTTVFGRSSNSADIVLDDSGVSRRHFEITVRDGHATATDLGSTNGTLLDGRRITSVTLTDGARLTAGDTEVLFRHREMGG